MLRKLVHFTALSGLCFIRYFVSNINYANNKFYQANNECEDIGYEFLASSSRHSNGEENVSCVVLKMLKAAGA